MKFVACWRARRSTSAARAYITARMTLADHEPDLQPHDEALAPTKAWALIMIKRASFTPVRTESGAGTHGSDMPLVGDIGE